MFFQMLTRRNAVNPGNNGKIFSNDEQKVGSNGRKRQNMTKLADENDKKI